MASNRKTQLPSTAHDAILGEPLRRGTLRIRVTDRDKKRLPQFQSPIPMRIHCRAEERVRYEDGPVGDLSERLGCNEFAPAFTRYLDEGFRSDKQKAREWWNMPYVLDRLAVHAQSGRGATFTLDEMNIALAYSRGYDLSESGRTHYWIDRAVARVTRYVRKHFLPYETKLAA